ncbi:MAG TPA: BTAD domain-containing putative transcriptional regulator [Anaerolineales bacterium]|nr:BTAD domain-containing putative transcriptional regulator [Anaerolineales bacterium]
MVRSSYRVYLLGSFQIEYVDSTDASVELIHLPRRKAEALLSHLILHPQTHSREKLAALLWGDFSDAQARASLRNALAILRKALGENLFLTEHDLIQINPDYPLWVDIREFERQTDPEAAIALYRGDLLSDFYDDWILAFRDHYRELYLSALLNLTQAYRAQSEYERAIEIAKKILEKDPANERAHQQLMFCYMASGDRQAALEQYGKAERVLQEEFAIEPAPETNALNHWIKQTPSDVPSFAARITNLPIPLTSFIGRKQESREVKKLLAHSRLLTLTGAGGSGKTRLAIQVATDLIDQFKDGVWWVDLAPLTDEVLVPQIVAKALGVREVPNQPLLETLAGFLDEKQLLLVIDNCEHLITASAQLANHLLTQCSNLCLLATSRELLNITGETVWPVPKLSVPETETLSLTELLMSYESIRLFVERAQSVSADFELTTENALSVVQICRRLDGIPLAIELAAARVKVLSPAQISARLDDRFNLLTRGSRTALPRQQTLRALIDWSYDLLSENERVLFRRLAVFAGGFTLDAAGAICGADNFKESELLDCLSGLVEKSLIIVEKQRHEKRYDVLETIRQYAADRLLDSREEERIRANHRDYFLAMAEQAEPRGLWGAVEITWLNRFELEAGNLRAALEWSMQHGEAEEKLHFAWLIVWYWYVRAQFSEGRRWLEQALTTSNGASASTRALALMGLGNLVEQQGEYARAAELLEEALRLFHELKNSWRAAWTLQHIGLVALFLSDYHRATSAFTESLTLFRERQDKGGIATLLMYLGITACYKGENEGALALLEESLPMLRELGDEVGIARALHGLGLLAQQKGDFDNAASMYAEGLMLAQQRGARAEVADYLRGFADLACAQNKFERAARLFGAEATLREAIGYPVPSIEAPVHEQNLSTVRALLGEEKFSQAWAEGHVMEWTQASEYALSERE